MLDVKSSHRTGSKPSTGASDPAAAAPLETLGSTLRATARALMADESSGFNAREAERSAGEILNAALGEKMLHGVVITSSSGAPEMHVLNTELRPILRSLDRDGGRLVECIQKYQGLSGTTPSRAALRLFGIMLKKRAADPDTRAAVHAICEEAHSINLISPVDKSWKREMSMQLNGVPIKVALSLVPLSAVTRGIIRHMDTDVPQEDRQNRYAYRLTLEPEVLTESPGLKGMKRFARQGIAAVSVMGPIAIAYPVIVASGVSEMIPTVSSSPLMQSIVGECARLTLLAGLGAVMFKAVRSLVERRVLGPDDSAARSSDSAGHDAER